MDDIVWGHSVFSKNRQRLLRTGTASAFFSSIRDQAKGKSPISDEHFTVDGTLLEAWASMKRFRPKDDGSTGDPPVHNPTVDFTNQKRTNDTHASTTGPYTEPDDNPLKQMNNGADFPGKWPKHRPNHRSKQQVCPEQRLNPPRGKPRGIFTGRIKKAISSSLANPAASGEECARYRGSMSFVKLRFHLNKGGKQLNRCSFSSAC